MRFARLTTLTFLALAAPTAWAFDNEPDGFRGITWGAAPGSIEGLVAQPGLDREIQNVVREDTRMTLKNFPLESYTRAGDKMEFADAEMTAIVYQFYKGRFVRAFLQFPDSRHTPQGDAYAHMHEIGAPPPKHYESKQQVDRGLKKYFGKPTSQSKFILKLAIGASRVEYKGDTTTIFGDCKGVKPTDCFLIFSSTQIGAELDRDFDAAVTALKTEKAELDAQKKADEAKQKARPDF